MNEQQPLTWPVDTTTDLPPGHPDAAPQAVPTLPPGMVWGIDSKGNRVPAYDSRFQPGMTAQEQPAAQPSKGLPPGAKKVIIVTACANFTVLSISGAFVLIANGVADMEPAMPAMTELMKWALYILVGLTALTVAVSARRKAGPLFHKETHNHTTTNQASGWFARATNMTTHNNGK